MNTRFYLLLLIVAVVLGGGACVLWMNRGSSPMQSQVQPPTTPLPTSLSFVLSNEDPTKYCNGVNMDSAGYKKTITVEYSTSTVESNPTPIQVIKATIHAATTGMCRSVLDQLNVTEKNGVVTIPPIDGWAGSSIVMCSCKPIVETNVLRIPGVTGVVWQ